ncbi:unnamed protein product [Periconia digitata]|uniref:Uncharacterized protein n=1 Tax=Periconia digitata TaxID=1303443 RepID=A0A9W4XKR1_9PLEO|nr:unnamed protein product [Periconia digitata]
MLTRIITLGFLATSQATLINNAPRDDCNPCRPQGATGSSSPSFGPDLKTLYTDVLGSVKDIHFRKRNVDATSPENGDSSSLSSRADAFCCRESLDCVNIQNLNIPMCYDKFTTNFQLPDGSYGSLTTGDFSSGGSKANLFTGQYSKDGGESGNIYANDAAAKPNTATLSIPPQFTGTGVGSAIPASEIASLITTTSTGSAGPVTMTTTAPSSMPTGDAENSSRPTSNSGAPAESQGTAGASPQGNAAGHVAIDSTKSFGMTIISGLVCLLFAF